MAAALTDAGANVVITGRDPSRTARTANELGPRALGIPFDVRDQAAVRAGVDRAYEWLGGLDLLVANAGIGMRTVNPRFMTTPQPFWEVSPEGFRDVVETKVLGSFLVAREVAPRMLAHGAGRIVVISMNTETMHRRGFVPYGPSGAAVEAMASVFAADLQDSAIAVNILLPGGATATGMVPEDVPDNVRAQLLKPEIMGPPIVWLASAAADGVHGQRIEASKFDAWLAAR
jgi:NAD(P)-dependent dehydrogenase (short-subunit alcohol dehydrogenase family)